MKRKQIAIITGASSGIGREFVKQIAGGFPKLDEIWVIARREERLVDLARHISVPLNPLIMDLEQKGDWRRLEKLLHEEQPLIRFLVNSAGFGKIGKIGDIGAGDELGMVLLNCGALCEITRMSIPYMAENSRIIQMSSAAAFLPQPEFAIYAASKSFVLSYSRAVNAELRKQGVYVTAVCPGPVRTEFFQVAERTGTMPIYKRLCMANPERVVAQALRDSISGKEVSVYGLTMKAFRLLCKATPHFLVLKAMRWISDREKDDQW